MTKETFLMNVRDLADPLWAEHMSTSQFPNEMAQFDPELGRMLRTVQELNVAITHYCQKKLEGR